MTTETREQRIARRLALAQKYLDEYGISEDFTSRHGNWWLGIALPDDQNAEDGAAVVATDLISVKRFLTDAIRNDPTRWPELIVHLGSDTKYTADVDIILNIKEQS